MDKNIAALATRSRESGRILIVKFDDGSESELMRRKRSALGSIPNYSTMRSQSASLELPSFFVVMSDRSKRNSGDHQRARTHTISLSPILIVYCNDTSAEIAPTSTPQISNEDELLRTLAKFNVSSKHRRVGFFNFREKFSILPQHHTSTAYFILQSSGKRTICTYLRFCTLLKNVA